MGDLIFIGSVFCALISAYILLFKKNIVQLFSDRILAFLFLCYSYCTIGYLLISSGWLIHFPFLYRTSAPVNYLIPPLAYLYVKSVLNNKNKWRWVDALHLIPFVLISINYIPLFTMSIENKNAIVKMVVDNYTNNYNIQDGYLSENIQFLRPIQSLIYILLQWRLIYTFEKNNKSEIFQEHTAIVLTWLKKFTIAITFTILTFLIFVIGVIFSLSTKQSIVDIVFYSSIPVEIILFYLSSYLIINSNVFLGLPYFDYDKNNIKVEVLDKAKYEAEIEAIDSTSENAILDAAELNLDAPSIEFSGANLFAEPSTQSIVLEVAPEAIAVLLAFILGAIGGVLLLMALAYRGVSVLLLAPLTRRFVERVTSGG